MRVNLELLLVVLGLAFTAGLPAPPQRIVGGTVTTIDNYPFGAVMLFSMTGTGNFIHSCGGTIINNRSILTAAHCFTFFGLTSQWRIRVGSSFASSGGVVHTTSRIINHPAYDINTDDSDIAIVHSSTAFAFNTNVQTGSVAGPTYEPGDNQPVWAIGWGRIAADGPSSEQLRHVQVWTINQETCRQRYAAVGRAITDNMLCSGVLDVGGRDQCQGDSGGPLIHGSVVVGVCSWGQGCGDPRFPGVNVRVPRFTSWIQTNA